MKVRNIWILIKVQKNKTNSFNITYLWFTTSVRETEKKVTKSYFMVFGFNLLIIKFL